jgi:hypothetical protein
MNPDMTSRELMRRAMRREPVSRIPTMPQICHDTPVRIYANGVDADWIDGIAECIRDPARIYDYVIRLVKEIDCDGLRLFVKPDPVAVARVGNELIVVDEDGNRTGVIDLEGGGGVRSDVSLPAVESVDEAKVRCRSLVDDYTDEKMAMLKDARDRVPDRFVASSPLGMTMNTYSILRGRERSLFDLYDRPDLVKSIMQVQLEAAIVRGERLIPTGIDAFYIGDPSASASLISPSHFETYCLPVYRAFCRHFRDEPILIYIHVCGNSDPILEMLADTGADTVEPLDPLGGVSVADAKRRIGDRVCLMGGLNTITLARGTPDEVRAEALQKCSEGGPEGYILAAGDMVPPLTTLANLHAMIGAARDFRLNR